MTTVTIRVRNMAQAIEKVNEVERKTTSEREGGVLRATNQVAKVWAKNFAGEGSAVGGWAALRPRTQRTREWQGFSPRHPILYRYGTLRGVMVDFFQQARGSGEVNKADTYSGHITTGALSIKDGVAKLEGRGWKIANQWGYPAANGAGETPARRFWFVDDSVIGAARQGVVDWLLDEVVK